MSEHNFHESDCVICLLNEDAFDALQEIKDFICVLGSALDDGSTVMSHKEASSIFNMLLREVNLVLSGAFYTGKLLRISKIREAGLID
ncbi:TPA: hypothetical protein ACHGD4_000007 [Escherichia coli]|nr:hypothetical protein [Escherichia coli O146]